MKLQEMSTCAKHLTYSKLKFLYARPHMAESHGSSKPINECKFSIQL